VLEAWARRLLPGVTRRLPASVIGGRQPSCAQPLRRLGGSGLRGLCVLDRDDGATDRPATASAQARFFCLGRRRIEATAREPAIVRTLRRRTTTARRRTLRGTSPSRDERAWRDIDAKPPRQAVRAARAGVDCGRLIAR
jgi:hypothetical protein